MDYFRHVLGKRAEEHAWRFLQDQGLKPILRNYRCYFGEIDLIMLDRDDIVFVEVRSRRRVDFGNALESIRPGKIRKLMKTATHFLQKKHWLHKRPSRFDVVAIHPVDGKMQLEWIKNAFISEAFQF